MAARHAELVKSNRALATVAARLALASGGRPKTLREILTDAERLRRASLNARSAIASNRSPNAAYTRAQRVAERYDAVVLAPACSPERPLVLLFSFGGWGEGSEFDVA